MELKVEKYIKEHQLFKKTDKLTIAVSGGIDSMALLTALYHLEYQITVAHVNHNVREESKEEFAFVKNYCATLNIPFVGTVLPKNIAGNFQDTARKLRYDFLLDVAKDGKILLTAHHQDDQIETILMKLLRGSNLYGYAGIKPFTYVNNIKIARPLLNITRDEITEYVKTYKIPYREDKSNASNKYTRNRFRHDIIPILKEESKNLYNGFNDFSMQILEAFNHIRSEVTNIYYKNNETINIKEYLTYSDAIRHDLIALMLNTKNIQINNKKILLIEKLLLNDKPNSFIDVGESYIIKKEYNKAYICKKEPQTFISLTINEFGIYPLYEGKKLFFGRNLPNNKEKYLKLCYNKIDFPITIRSRINGDYIKYPYGGKKIKDLFIDLKIPSDKRCKIPIVVNKNNEILGIIGIGPSIIADGINDYVYLFIKE